MAVAIMFCGIAAVALPLAQEFGITREIDDRVMCPLPVAAVAIEKICFSAMQSMIAAAVVFPLGVLHSGYAGGSACHQLAVSDRGAGSGEPHSGALGLTIGTASSRSRSGLSSVWWSCRSRSSAASTIRGLR